jgi:hypothetical protein
VIAWACSLRQHPGQDPLIQDSEDFLRVTLVAPALAHDGISIRDLLGTLKGQGRAWSDCELSLLLSTVQVLAASSARKIGRASDTENMIPPGAVEGLRILGNLLLMLAARGVTWNRWSDAQLYTVYRDHTTQLVMQWSRADTVWHSWTLIPVLYASLRFSHRVRPRKLLSWQTYSWGSDHCANHHVFRGHIGHFELVLIH